MPIIAMTANAFDDDIEKSKAAGDHPPPAKLWAPPAVPNFRYILCSASKDGGGRPLRRGADEGRGGVGLFFRLIYK